MFRILRVQSSHVLKSVLCMVVLLLFARASVAQESTARRFPAILANDSSLEWDRTPYSVLVHLTFSGSPGVSARLRQELQSEITEYVADQAGATWEFTIEEQPGAAWNSVAGLQRLTAADVPVLPDERPQPDKQYFVVVTQSAKVFSAAVREWDETTQDFSPVQSVSGLRSRDLPERAAGLLSRVFRPLLRIVGSEDFDRVIFLSLRAGTLIPNDVFSDPTAQTLRYHIRPGTVLLPFFRYSEKGGKFRKNQFLPWTFLSVTGVERGRVTCSWTTGIRAAVTARQSKRVKSFAVAVQPLFESTTIELRLRRNSQRKLAAHDVLISASNELNSSPEDLLDERYTDRRGVAEVPQYPGQTIVWMYVKSGKQLLAKLPFVPGLDRRLQVDLPDDGVRLKVEGEVAQIRGRLVDTIAQQQAAMIRARKHAKANKWELVDAELEKIRALPELKDFTSELGDLEKTALATAGEQKNRIAERKIIELCADTRTLLARYLDPKKRKEFFEEIAAQRN